MDQAGENRGKDALHRHPAPGARPKLSTEQLAELPGLLDRGRSVWVSRSGVDRQAGR